MPKPKTQSKSSGIFSIRLEGVSKASDLVKRGRYDWLNEWITDDHFPIQPNKPVGRMIKLVKFDHDPSSKQVIGEFRRLGLKRPTYKDAFVFLHESVPDQDGRLSVLALHMGVRRRGLGMYWFDAQWGRQCVFAGVSK